MITGLENKVVVITGGANGIGEETVKLFSIEGAIPIILDKDSKKGNFLKEELNYENFNVDYINLDLTNKKVCKEAINYIIKNYNKIDVLVNNAGINDFIGIDSSVSGFRNSLERNLVHYFTMSKYCWPHLKKSKGNIVNIGSAISFTGEKGTIAYPVAKGGINSLTRALALEGASYGIRVNAVLPGEVKTKMYEEYLLNQGVKDMDKAMKNIGKEVPLEKRMTSKKEIANTIVFLASNKLSGHTTGQLISVDGGVLHLRKD